jgi:hypothetical protein
MIALKDYSGGTYLKQRRDSLLNYMYVATGSLCPICSLLPTNTQTLIISRRGLQLDTAGFDKFVERNSNAS